MHFHNLLAAFLIFELVYFCRSEEQCLNFDEDGTCHEPCPEGTFAYHPSCEDEAMSQRTCRRREARSMGYICDYVRCDCLDDKYWDEAHKKCVLLEECSNQFNVEES